MAEGQHTGQIDLEKELSCSICTEILFQPLTLLDCLHTFCGACLKEWFSFQAASARSLHPYTCPSCRATVRGTRPHATVTTLVDMYLQANPGKDRSEEDKQEQKQKYKPGDNVLPKLRLRAAPRDDEDQRTMNEVMALSLREAGISSNSLQEPGRPQHTRGRRSRDSSRSGGNHRRDGSQLRSGHSRQRSSRGPSREPSPPRNVPTRHIEHQSSLRSLLSTSDLDPQDLQEEILRQIAEEGLLDDVDLADLDGSQEEELSERIAQAFHRRRQEGRRERQPVEQSANGGRQRDRGVQNSPQPANRSAGEEPNPSRPPMSNPHLIQSANQGHVRTNSGSRSSANSASRTDTASTVPPPTSTTAGASSSSSLVLPSTERRRRLSHERSATDPDRVRNMSRRSHAQSNPTPGSAPGSPRIPDSSSTAQGTRRPRADSNPRPHRSPLIGASTFPSTGPTNNSVPSLTTTQTQQSVPTSTASTSVVLPSGLALAPVRSEVRSSSSSSGQKRHALFTEPSISCNACGKPDLQYDLHYNCHKCMGGKYNLCLRCYRQEKGCLHWYGFGWGAWKRYEIKEPLGGYPPNHERPHTLSGHQFLLPTHPPVKSPTPEQPHRLVTEENPAKRLYNGVFCDICLTFANACYWKCEFCNEGGWGFCDNCVKQGRHCTHPLLPLKSKSTFQEDQTHQSDHLAPPQRPQDQQQPSPPSTPKTASIVDGQAVVALANMAFQPLTFSTLCDICTRSISPLDDRFHCPRCNDGDYDICTSCYHSLISNHKISKANGDQGWRRCPQGHRMVVVRFENSEGGQRRVVVRDLVGGWALKEDEIVGPNSSSTSSSEKNWIWTDEDGTVRAARSGHSTQALRDLFDTSMNGRFPPDSGIGLRVYAKWGYYPLDDAQDELMFPKFAEIREAENINGDWFLGVYAGRKGLFPGNYGHVIA